MMGRWSRFTAAASLVLALVLAPITAFAGGDTSPDGRAEVSFVEGLLDPSGQLWFKVGFYNTWGIEPPRDLFSLFWRLTVTVGDREAVVGWETHDGTESFLGDAGTQAFILDNGCVLVGTGIYPEGDFSVSILAEFGSWQDEQATQAVFGQTQMGTSAQFIDAGDPFSAFGVPVFDLLLGTGYSSSPSTTSSTTTSPSSTTTAASSTTTSATSDGTTGLGLGDGGGLSVMWVIVFLILALGALYWASVFQFRWWDPPFPWMPRPGGRYAYRVAGGMFEDVTEQPADDGGDDVTEDEQQGDPHTDTDTRTGTDAPFDGGGDGETTGGTLPPAVFEDRTPTRRDCQKLRLACEDAKDAAARAREDADMARRSADESAAECDSARARVAELEAKVADLDSREDAPQRYQRLAEAQQALRDATAGIDEICKVAAVQQAWAEHQHEVARKAQLAADEACRQAEECEQQLGE